MKKLVDIDNSDGPISVYIDNLYSKEIYCDGVIDEISFPNTTKIRFYTNTGLLEDRRIIVEHNVSLVLSNSCVEMLRKLLCDRSTIGNTKIVADQASSETSNKYNDPEISHDLELVHSC